MPGYRSKKGNFALLVSFKHHKSVITRLTGNLVRKQPLTETQPGTWSFWRLISHTYTSIFVANIQYFSLLKKTL